jgi:hypothetical protein
MNHPTPPDRPRSPVPTSPSAPARSPAPTLQGQATPNGRWIIWREDDRQALSEHDTASEAERVARHHSDQASSPLVLLHDRYDRVRRLPDRGA